MADRFRHFMSHKTCLWFSCSRCSTAILSVRSYNYIVLSTEVCDSLSSTFFQIYIKASCNAEKLELSLPWSASLYICNVNDKGLAVCLVECQIRTGICGPFMWRTVNLLVQMPRNWLNGHPGFNMSMSHIESKYFEFHTWTWGTFSCLESDWLKWGTRGLPWRCLQAVLDDVSDSSILVWKFLSLSNCQTNYQIAKQNPITVWPSAGYLRLCPASFPIFSWFGRTLAKIV